MESLLDGNGLYVIRDYDPDTDFELVMSNWMRSYRKGRTRPFKDLPHDRFMSGHRKVVLDLLASTSLRVVCLADTPDAIAAWACAEPTCLHYVYVKKAFRKRRFADALVDDAASPRYFSHQTFAFLNFARRRGMTFSPGFAFYQQPETP